jgi:galactofuranosylgalactofuranosylrhamnosyl-N-acetylglucosaminyl-diphospho-decaprenol beta-1,5/1,6-galactofuranosyltransferase
VAALHAEVDPRRTARVIASRMMRYVMTMQYGLAATIIKAVEDFLSGPDQLEDGGASRIPEVFALRKQYPDTVMHKPTDVPGLRSAAIPQVQAGPKPTRHRLVMIKRLVYLAAVPCTRWVRCPNRTRRGGTCRSSRRPW